MGMVRALASGVVGFAVGAGMMMTPNGAKLRRMALKQASSVKRNMARR